MIVRKKLFRVLLATIGLGIVEVAEKSKKANEGLTNTLLSGINPNGPCISKILEVVSQGERDFELDRITK